MILRIFWILLKMLIKHKFIRRPIKPSKYLNKITFIDGYNFPSIAEAKRYKELKLLQTSGEVVFFLRQVPFHLPIQNYEKPVKYLCDFMIFWANGNITIEDVKGFSTDIFERKKLMVEKYFPVTIGIIK